MTPVHELARRLFSEHPVERHPLLLALEERSLTSPQVGWMAQQIFHVVECFPRHLAALLAQMPDWRLRMEVAENLWEEHGRGRPSHVHVETYRVFLRALGVTDAQLRESRPSLAVVTYNRAVLDLCLHQPFPEALGALGAIEEVVSRASPRVARYASSARKIDRDAVGHFGDHETLDVTHAHEFYTLCARVFEGPAGMQVERGLRLGLYLHYRLYSELLSAATNPAYLGGREG